MALVATYDGDLARVQLVGTTWGATVAYVVVDRFDNAQLTNPTVVRGGSRVPMTAGQTLRIDDYEFNPGVLNTYRVRAYNASDVEVPTYSYTQTITPNLGTIWLKSPVYPFLNRPVTVVDFSAVATPARGGVMEVLGRRDPVAVTEVRGSRRYELVLRAADADEVDAINLALSFGLTVFLHVPAGCAVPASMHAWVGDVTTQRPDGAKHDTAVRYVTVPLVECAPPDPAIVGSTATYGGLASAFATYADLAAALPTYLDVATYVSAPDDEVVG